MDGWAQIFDQLRSFWRRFSTAQRISLSIVSLSVLGFCCWIGFSAYRPRQEFLLGGKSFSKDELTRTLEAFKAAGLVRHKVEGQRISVPADEADRYTAAAVAQKALPAQFAAEFDRMQSRVNVFTSGEQRRELLEEARKTRLAQILRAIPEIEDAVVEWDRPKSTSLFRPQNQLAAHVSVRPRDGRELSLELVQSLKQFVAGALAGATPEDVTVVDMNTSRVHGRRTSAEAAADRIQSLTKQSVDDITRQITRALQYIPNALVSVNVELMPDVDSDASDAIDDLEVIPVKRNFRKSTIQKKSGANRPVAANINPASLRKRPFHSSGTSMLTDTIADEGGADSDSSGLDALHKSVQVAISIPEDFYSALARRQGLAPGTTLVADSEYRATIANIKMESQRDIRAQLGKLLPLGTPADAISITSYTRLNSPMEIEAVAKQRAHVTGPYWEWATMAGVVFSSTCGLWLLSRLLMRTRQSNPTAVTEDSQENSSINPDVSELKSEGPPQVEMPQPVQPEAMETTNRSTLPGATLESPKESLIPYSAILSELAERERDSVLGSPVPTGMFEFLCQLPPTEMAEFLHEEHPQVIALVATGMPPNRAAATLHALPEALRWDVTQRISRLGPTAPEICREVAQCLSARLRERQARGAVPANGSGSKNGIRPRPAFRQQTAAAANLTDSESKIERGPVSFEDLCVLDRLSFAAVLRTVDAKSFAVALFDRSEPFKQRFLSLLPRPFAAAILQQTRGLGPLRLSDITASQEAIAGIIWSMAQQGSINLPPHLVRTKKRNA